MIERRWPAFSSNVRPCPAFMSGVPGWPVIMLMSRRRGEVARRGVEGDAEIRFLQLRQFTRLLHCDDLVADGLVQARVVRPGGPRAPLRRPKLARLLDLAGI